MPVNTVNVIEMVDESMIQLVSFVDDETGNKEAEIIFQQFLLENYPSLTNLDTFIEDGFYENSNYKLYLVHSTS